MRVIEAITVAATIAANIPGAGLPMSEKREMTVCMDRNADSTVLRAQEVASKIYEPIGVRIRWGRNTPDCISAPNSIVVRLLDNTAPKQHPGSLAFSAPYQGKDIAVYYDRVRAMGRSESSVLLGYVLAHEIAHIAQGITRHSDKGILKSHWDGRDRSHMRHMDLQFTEEDIELIRRGLDARGKFLQALR